MDLSLTPLLLLPLVAGYIFIKEWEVVRYSVAIEDGHRLYFRSAFHGVIITAISFLILRAFDAPLITASWKSPELYTQLANHFFELPVSKLTVFFTLVVSPFVAKLLAITLNIFSKAGNHYYIALQDNELELLLAKSIFDIKMVMITLEDEKVYVGFVTKLTDPTKERKFVSIRPLISGYRSETKEVIFTTFYEDIYSGKHVELEHLAMDDYIVVLRADKVISARIFDSIAYSKFKQSAEQKTQDDIL